MSISKLASALPLSISLAFAGAASARYIESDPIGLAAGPSTYTYANDNPLKRVDPTGLDTAVVVNGATQNNPFGHVAIAVTGSGVYSFGNTTKLGSSLTAYLQREAARRNSNVIVIKTTPEQEKAILEYLRKHKDDVNSYPDNCAGRTSNALKAGGMPDIYDFFGGTNEFPSDTTAQAEIWRQQLGGSTFVIPKNSTTIPAALEQFNP
jgi:uncharacterized protein RhaS with RHS repeats